MPMPNPHIPDPREPKLPDSFDVGSIESPAQQILREEFEHVTAANRTTLAGFEPDHMQGRADIALTTSFPEAEAADPQLTDMMRASMLNQLGLTFRRLEAGDPANIFQYRYRSGEVDQIRLVQREDGVQIPVLTQLASDAAGNEVERVRLLSNDEAERHKQRLEDNIDEQKINQRLKKEFDLDEGFLQHAGMSLEDKRAMMAAYDEMQQLDVVKPDLKVLQGIRKKLAKNMMPGAQFIEAIRNRDKLPDIAEEYETQMSDIIEEHGLQGKALTEFVQSERLLRLEALNKQLARRRRSVKVGSTVMTTLMPPFTAGGGALAGFEATGATPKGAAIGAIVGGVVGVSLAVERRVNLKHAMRNTAHGFDSSGYGDYSEFGEQLLDEQHLARTYVARLSNL